MESLSDCFLDGVFYFWRLFWALGAEVPLDGGLLAPSLALTGFDLALEADFDLLTLREGVFFLGSFGFLLADLRLLLSSPSRLADLTLREGTGTRLELAGFCLAGILGCFWHLAFEVLFWGVLELLLFGTGALTLVADLDRDLFSLLGMAWRVLINITF
jgi:hypothetical protein